MNKYSGYGWDTNRNTEMKEKRDYKLPIRWTYEEKQMIEVQAAMEGLSVSAFVRTKIINYCQQRKKEQ